MPHFKYAGLALCALFASGCTSTGVVPMDSGTYLLSKRSAQVGFGPPIRAKADIYREANAFCAKQGKQVETVKLETTDSYLARPAAVLLQFRCAAVESKAP